MDRWVGKVALVTGASAGIGAAISESLVQHGLKVVGLARRVERIEELKVKLAGARGQLYSRKGDVSNAADVEETFKWIAETFGTIHVLVNNAGISRNGTITDGKFEDFQQVINVNLLGLVACTQKTLQLMKSASVDDGHIININSIAGHYVPQLPIPVLNVYAATKHAVTAFNETVRQELQYLKTKTKITSISPGAVETEIGQAAKEATGSDAQALPAEFAQEMPKLQSEDVAEAVVYVLATGPHVQVHELIIRPVGEAF